MKIKSSDNRADGFDRQGFGERLCRAYTEKFGKEGQHILAERIGMKPPQLSNYVTGTTQPKAEAIIRIARGLEVSTDYLLMGTEPSCHRRHVDDAEAAHTLQDLEYDLGQALAKLQTLVR